MTITITINNVKVLMEPRERRYDVKLFIDDKLWRHHVYSDDLEAEGHMYAAWTNIRNIFKLYDKKRAVAEIKEFPVFSFETRAVEKKLKK
jgi:hypothetical protein